MNEFFKEGAGVVLNEVLQKCSYRTDLFPNTLYRKCIIYAHTQRKEKEGGCMDIALDP